jgi:hypothetical protein
LALVLPHFAIANALHDDASLPADQVITTALERFRSGAAGRV